jgi:hypothetical protein
MNVSCIISIDSLYFVEQQQVNKQHEKQDRILAKNKPTLCPIQSKLIYKLEAHFIG